MSDYMFMLESHLTGQQNRAVQLMVSAAQECAVNLFLTGAAIRDMIGGFPIRDLGFAVEGTPAKLFKLLESRGCQRLSADDARKSAEFLLPEGIVVSLAMSAQERYAKAGGKPHITPAPIYDHLRSQDFTINAMALSLTKGSRGLLIDPTNGAGDLSRRELRAVGNYTLYDDPSRILRLVRLRVRLGFAIEARTQSQMENARAAEVEKLIPAAARRNELRRAAGEPRPAELIKAYEENGLLTLFSPDLTGSKVNHAGFLKLEKALGMIPHGATVITENLALFLAILLEPFTPKERTALIQCSGLTDADVAQWKKLEPRSKKLETALISEKLSRASQIYQLLSQSAGDEVLYLLCRPAQRLAADRVRNYLQKHLLTVQEVTDAEVTAAKSVTPEAKEFPAAKASYIAARLDGRIKKAPPPEPPPPGPPPRRFN
jgi:tRNA nucleotidyltransferase/poly(A) polymerase